MNLEAKIAAATRCLEREYPKGVPAALQDAVEVEITREHYLALRQRIAGWVREYLDVSIKVAHWLQLDRGGRKPAPDHSQLA